VTLPLPKSNTGDSLKSAYATYLRQLDQQEVSHQSDNLMAFEYQAKARGRQLETLLHLSHFSDYLVLISAPSGAGKTTFIDQFLRAQPAKACIVHLALQEPATAPWVVRQLAQQLPVQLPNQASLEHSIMAIQALAQELKLQKEVLLIVVDDAQWLDEDGLELLANLLPRNAQIDARPHVILCADHSVVERIETPHFAELRQERFYHLVLSPFNQEESADYLRQRLQRIGINHGLAPIQLLQLHQLAKGNPGYLNMLANKAINKGGFVQQAGLPLLHIGATSLVLVVLVGIWLFNYVSANVLEQRHVESSPVAIQPVVIEPIATALPPLEPIELSPAPKNVSPQPKVQLKLSPKPAVQVTQPPAKQAAALIPVSVLKAWPLATSKTKQPYSYKEVLKLPSDHYSLQVLGARLETTLEAFIVDKNITQPLYAIKLDRGGQPWYMLLVGDYESASKAQSAISSLPIALRNQQPWARPVLKIQQQIRNKFNTSGE